MVAKTNDPLRLERDADRIRLTALLKSLVGEPEIISSVRRHSTNSARWLKTPFVLPAFSRLLAGQDFGLMNSFTLEPDRLKAGTTNEDCFDACRAGAVK